MTEEKLVELFDGVCALPEAQQGMIEHILDAFLKITKKKGRAERIAALRLELLTELIEPGKSTISIGFPPGFFSQ